MMLAQNFSEREFSSAESDFIKDSIEECFDRSLEDKASLLGGLNRQQLRSLFGVMKKDQFQRGDIIFAQGQLPCNIYIVVSGEVQLSVLTASESCVAQKYSVGDCFGESAVIGIQPQIGEARAKSDVSALVLSRQGLLSLMESDAELFAILMMNVAREASRRLHGSFLGASATRQ